MTYRVGVEIPPRGSVSTWQRLAREVEAAGFDTLLVPDHLDDQLAPLVAIAAATAVTTRVRLGTFMLQHEFYHPVLLARDLAALHDMSAGRLELAASICYMQSERDRLGLLDADDRELERSFREWLENLSSLLAGGVTGRSAGDGTFGEHADAVQETRQSPIKLMLPDRHDEALALAVQKADAVVFTGMAPYRGNGPRPALAGLTSNALADRIEKLHALAAGRDHLPEIAVLLQKVVITADPEAEAEAMAARLDGLGPAQLLDSPHFLIGDLPAIASKLDDLHDKFGVGYFICFDWAREAMGTVMAHRR